MADYNEKVLAKSSWITRELLEPVVERIVGTNVTIQHVDISAAVGAGDNYVSILYRTKVVYVKNGGQDGGVCHLIVKGPPGNEFLTKIFQEMGFIKKEIAVYNKCLPYMNRLQDRFFEKDRLLFCPESHPCDFKDTVIMEDLKMADYKLANRQEQLDFDHSVAALRCLARFHALSVMVKESEVDWFDEVADELFTKEHPERTFMYHVCMLLFAEYVDKWGAEGRVVKLFDKFTENLAVKMCETVRVKHDRLNVLNHGDLWTNNVMFQYNQDGGIDGVKLLDYQVTRYSSPVLDLLYFFFSSIKPEVLSTRMFDLVEEYHRHLMNDLRQLDLHQQHGITLEQLKEDLRDHAYFGIVVIGTLLPIATSEPSDAIDMMDDIDEEEAEKENEAAKSLQVSKKSLDEWRTYFKSDNIKRKALQVVKVFDDIGYLEAAHEATKHLVNEK